MRTRVLNTLKYIFKMRTRVRRMHDEHYPGQGTLLGDNTSRFQIVRKL